MRNQPVKAWTKLLLTAGVGTLAVSVVAGLFAPRLLAQSATVPQWQTDAGGKMAFDVASVRQDTAEPSAATTSTNVPLGDQDNFVPTGGLFSASDYRLLNYLIFAYKIPPSQWVAVESQLPKWVEGKRYDIRARAAGNPGKNQFRLMMQTLLAERFKIAVHYEERQVPVFALVEDKKGKKGPRLQPHASDPPCSNTVPPAFGAVPKVAGGFPAFCGGVQVRPSNTPGRIDASARNVPMAIIANMLGMQQVTGVDRPVLDKTELTGMFDFDLEFVPPDNSEDDPTGPTFSQALRDQLGLKLDSSKGAVNMIVIDHLEPPTEN